MRDRLPQKGGFGRNVLVLVSGTSVAQAIPIAFSPILTRMYSPRDFGVLAIFVAVTTVLGAVATGRYELAVMLTETEEDAVHLMRLCIATSASVALVLLSAVIVGRGWMADVLGSPEIEAWLFLAPPTVFLLGLFQALNYYNTRSKRFALIAQATAMKSAGGVAVQLGAGAAGLGAGGLVLGQASASAFSNGRLLRAAHRYSKNTAVDGKRMTWLGKRFRRFPLLSMPAVLANTLAVQLVNVLISVFFTVATLGAYSLVQRIMGLPSSLIGQSVSQVYYQSASEAYRTSGSAQRLFDRTTRQMALFSVPAFAVAFAVSPVVFEVVFGSEWRVAGEYARLLAPLFCIRFIVVAVSTTTSVFERQGVALVWQVALLVISVGSLVVAHLANWTFVEFITLYSLGVGLHYVLLWVVMRRMTKGG